MGCMNTEWCLPAESADHQNLKTLTVYLGCVDMRVIMCRLCTRRAMHCGLAILYPWQGRNAHFPVQVRICDENVLIPVREIKCAT
jgi:hypothetical protein